MKTLDQLDPLPILGNRAQPPLPEVEPPQPVEQPKPLAGQLVIDDLWWAFPIHWYTRRGPL
jgi:hypothetical protein